MDLIKSAVRGIRNVRAEMNVPPSKKATVYVVSNDNEIVNTFESGKVFFATLGYASEVFVQADKTGISEDAVSTMIDGAVIYMPFAELVDLEKEVERLKKEEGKLEGEIKRATGMLNNPNFVGKAPAQKLEEEKAKLVKYQGMLAQVKARIEQLSK